MKTLKILLVEDEELNRIMANMAIKRFFPECSITLGKDGEELIDFVRKDRYDIIITDIRMPKKDGFSAVQELRNYDPPIRTPVIFMSGTLFDLEQESLFKVQPAYALGKPYDLPDLKAIIDKALSE